MWKVLQDEVPETLKNHFLIRKKNYGNENLKYPLTNCKR